MRSSWAVVRATVVRSSWAAVRATVVRSSWAVVRASSQAPFFCCMTPRCARERGPGGPHYVKRPHNVPAHPTTHTSRSNLFCKFRALFVRVSPDSSQYLLPPLLFPAHCRHPSSLFQIQTQTKNYEKVDQATRCNAQSDQSSQAIHSTRSP